MKMLSKEQYKVLIPYEERFDQAKCDYVRGLYRDDVSKLEIIYKELGYHLESVTCPSCILTMMKILGEHYDKYKIRYFNKNKKDENQNQTD